MMLGEGQVHRPSGKGVRGAYNALHVGAKKAMERAFYQFRKHQATKARNHRITPPYNQKLEEELAI
jgi:hypothetical protein